jgi:hypothetical protein
MTHSANPADNDVLSNSEAMLLLSALCTLMMSILSLGLL